MKKTILAALAFTLFAALTGCASVNTTATSNAEDSAQAIAALANAHEIELKKSALSLGDKWDVSADGVKVATITGKAVKVTETYSMDTLKGNLMGYEQEEFHMFLRKAHTFDQNGDTTGTIDENLHFLLYSASLKDQHAAPVGSLSEKFAFGMSGDIKDNSGNPAWSFKKKVLSIGASINLTKRNGEVDPMRAVWTTVILNEIQEAEANK